MNALELHNVSHCYFTKKEFVKSISNISLSIESGEFVSIVGPSGCGKSTILSLIANLLTPTEGTIIHNPPESRIGYMLQQDTLFPWKTIAQNVGLGLQLQNKQSDSEVQQLLKTLQLSHTIHKFPHELSGGMKQRIALARTLILEPSLLLFDEPFSALDFVTKLELENWVAETVKEFNQTCILVTHDLEEAIAMSNKIYILSKAPGRIVQVIHIPENIVALSPFDARQSPDFTTLFQKVWKELQHESVQTTT